MIYDMKLNLNYDETVMIIIMRREDTHTYNRIAVK